LFYIVRVRTLAYNLALAVAWQESTDGKHDLFLLLVSSSFHQKKGLKG
jgi:hypothetical protein